VLWKNFLLGNEEWWKPENFSSVQFTSFSVWNLAFLRNVWAFHFCSMWILITTGFHSPKVHFHWGIADNFPLCLYQLELGSHVKIATLPMNIFLRDMTMLRVNKNMYIKIWCAGRARVNLPHIGSKKMYKIWRAANIFS
jgi:hypothetical protein